MSNTSLRDYAELLLLSAIWGFSFLFLRIASPVLGPVFLVEMRVSSALIVMLPLLLVMGKWRELLQNWKMVALIGLTNMAIPFCFFAYAALNAGAGLLSIVNATVPFFTALLGFVIFSQRLPWVGIVGMATGFVGVVVLAVDPEALDSGPGSLWAVPAALFACSLYGLALNLVAYKMQSVSGVTITTGSLLVSSIVLIPFAAVSVPDSMPGIEVWGSVLTLGIVCTGLAYLLFYRLISRIGSNQAIMTTYLVPIFSILWGNLFLAESVTLFTLFGCMLVLLGVGMTTGRFPWLGKWRQAR
ncbi:MAG: DMT family transporter [Gammaproteobacteria bacterium]